MLINGQYIKGSISFDTSKKKATGCSELSVMQHGEL